MGGHSDVSAEPSSGSDRKPRGARARHAQAPPPLVAPPTQPQHTHHPQHQQQQIPHAQQHQPHQPHQPQHQIPDFQHHQPPPQPQPQPPQPHAHPPHSPHLPRQQQQQQHTAKPPYAAGFEAQELWAKTLRGLRERVSKRRCLRLHLSVFGTPAFDLAVLEEEIGLLCGSCDVTLESQDMLSGVDSDDKSLLACLTAVDNCDLFVGLIADDVVCQHSDDCEDDWEDQLQECRPVFPCLGSLRTAYQPQQQRQTQEDTPPAASGPAEASREGADPPTTPDDAAAAVVTGTDVLPLVEMQYAGLKARVDRLPCFFVAAEDSEFAMALKADLAAAGVDETAAPVLWLAADPASNGSAQCTDPPDQGLNNASTESCGHCCNPAAEHTQQHQNQPDEKQLRHSSQHLQSRRACRRHSHDGHLSSHPLLARRRSRRSSSSSSSQGVTFLGPPCALAALDGRKHPFARSRRCHSTPITPIWRPHQPRSLSPPRQSLDGAEQDQQGDLSFDPDGLDIDSQFPNTVGRARGRHASPRFARKHQSHSCSCADDPIARAAKFYAETVQQTDQATTCPSCGRVNSTTSDGNDNDNGDGDAGVGGNIVSPTVAITVSEPGSPGHPARQARQQPQQQPPPPQQQQQQQDHHQQQQQEQQQQQRWGDPADPVDVDKRDELDELGCMHLASAWDRLAWYLELVLAAVLPEQPLSMLQLSKELHRSFVSLLNKPYAPFPESEQQLDALVDKPDARAILVTGTKGCGKSSLLCNWARQRPERQPFDRVVSYHPQSSLFGQNMQHAAAELARQLDVADMVSDAYHCLGSFECSLTEVSHVTFRRCEPLHVLGELNEPHMTLANEQGAHLVIPTTCVHFLEDSRHKVVAVMNYSCVTDDAKYHASITIGQRLEVVSSSIEDTFLIVKSLETGVVGVFPACHATRFVRHGSSDHVLHPNTQSRDQHARRYAARRTSDSLGYSSDGSGDEDEVAGGGGDGDGAGGVGSGKNTGMLRRSASFAYPEKPFVPAMGDRISSDCDYSRITSTNIVPRVSFRSGEQVEVLPCHNGRLESTTDLQPDVLHRVVLVSKSHGKRGSTLQKSLCFLLPSRCLEPMHPPKQSCCTPGSHSPSHHNTDFHVHDDFDLAGPHDSEGFTGFDREGSVETGHGHDDEDDDDTDTDTDTDDDDSYDDRDCLSPVQEEEEEEEEEEKEREGRARKEAAGGQQGVSSTEEAAQGPGPGPGQGAASTSGPALAGGPDTATGSSEARGLRGRRRGRLPPSLKATLGDATIPSLPSPPLASPLFGGAATDEDGKSAGGTNGAHHGGGGVGDMFRVKYEYESTCTTSAGTYHVCVGPGDIVRLMQPSCDALVGVRSLWHGTVGFTLLSQLEPLKRGARLPGPNERHILEIVIPKCIRRVAREVDADGGKLILVVDEPGALTATEAFGSDGTHRHRWVSPLHALAALVGGSRDPMLSNVRVVMSARTAPSNPPPGLRELQMRSAPTPTREQIFRLHEKRCRQSRANRSPPDWAERFTSVALAHTDVNGAPLTLSVLARELHRLGVDEDELTSDLRCDGGGEGDDAAEGEGGDGGLAQVAQAAAAAGVGAGVARLSSDDLVGVLVRRATVDGQLMPVLTTLQVLALTTFGLRSSDLRLLADDLPVDSPTWQVLFDRVEPLVLSFAGFTYLGREDWKPVVLCACAAYPSAMPERAVRIRMTSHLLSRLGRALRGQLVHSFDCLVLALELRAQVGWLEDQGEELSQFQQSSVVSIVAKMESRKEEFPECVLRMIKSLFNELQCFVTHQSSLDLFAKLRGSRRRSIAARAGRPRR